MHQFRLAVATRCWNQPLTRSLRSIAELGVTGLQIDIRNEVRSDALSETGRRDFLHQISEHRLTLASAVFPLNHPLYETDKIDLRVAAIRDAMKFAHAIKIGTLCLTIGRIPEDVDSKDRQLLVEVLSDLARYSNHIGTFLAVTPANDSAETLRKLMSEIKAGPVGVDFDPAQFAMNKRSVADSLRSLHDLVLHVQLRDGVPGIDGGQERPVGEGNVDWIETLALLGEMDYRGWLTAIRKQGQDRAQDAVHALRFIQKRLLGA